MSLCPVTGYQLGRPVGRCRRRRRTRFGRLRYVLVLRLFMKKYNTRPEIGTRMAIPHCKTKSKPTNIWNLSKYSRLVEFLPFSACCCRHSSKTRGCCCHRRRRKRTRRQTRSRRHGSGTKRPGLLVSAKDPIRGNLFAMLLSKLVQAIAVVWDSLFTGPQSRTIVCYGRNGKPCELL